MNGSSFVVFSGKTVIPYGGSYPRRHQPVIFQADSVSEWKGNIDTKRPSSIHRSYHQAYHLSSHTLVVLQEPDIEWWNHPDRPQQAELLPTDGGHKGFIVPVSVIPGIRCDKASIKKL